MTVEVYGNTQECIDFALNQNGLTIDKIIITKDEFVKKLANPQTSRQLLQHINGCENIDEINAFLNSNEFISYLKTPLNTEYVRSLTQKIQEFFSSFDSIELKNYSFMSSMNTETYNIAIRSATNCHYSAYNVDKNGLQSAFEEVFTKYFNSTTTRLSTKESQFQIEITRFEDIKKHFYLYKQGSKLLLFSQVGLPQDIDGCEYHVYSEQYSSYQNILFYNKAQQEVALTKQGSKLGYEQISIKGKILDEQELTAIHQITNTLNDVVVEGYINPKGKVQLTHIQIFDLPIEPNQEHSFQLYASSQTHTNISLYPFHEVQSSTQRSKFMLLRNNAEFKSALSSQTFENIEGVIFTFSIFSPHLFTLCWYLDIDCIITKNQYSKMDAAEFNSQTLEIVSHTQEQEEIQTHNPFSTILPQNSQEEADSSNPLHAAQDQLNEQARAQSNQLREERKIQHQELQQQRQTSTSSSSSQSSSSGSKKSALAMMADEVLKVQEQKPQSVSEQESNDSYSQYQQDNSKEIATSDPDTTAQINNTHHDVSYQNPTYEQNIGGSVQNWQGSNHINDEYNSYQPREDLETNTTAQNLHSSHNTSSEAFMNEFNPFQNSSVGSDNDLNTNISSQNSDNLNYNHNSHKQMMLNIITQRMNQIREEQKELERMYEQLQ